jgi:hypothetical protein
LYTCNAYNDSKQRASRNRSLAIKGEGLIAMKKTARIICANDNEFWTTQKQFWQWVREGLVDVVGHHPLTGRFAGRREKLLVMIRHIVLDNASPNHKHEVLSSYYKLRPLISRKRPEDR